VAQSRRRPAPARTHAPAPAASAAPAAPVAPGASAAPAALAAAVATVADRLLLSPLVAAGLAVLLVGGLGDVIFHAAPPALAAVLAPLVGPAGERAHLLTFAGMLIASVGLLKLGLRRP
jgi:hypothetical protein